MPVTTEQRMPESRNRRITGARPCGGTSSETKGRQKRAATWHAFFTVQLLAGDAPLIDAANNLLEITSDVHHASDESDLQHRGALVRAELADFVTLASAQLR